MQTQNHFPEFCPSDKLGCWLNGWYVDNSTAYNTQIQRSQLNGDTPIVAPPKEQGDEFEGGLVKTIGFALAAGIAVYLISGAINADKK